MFPVLLFSKQLQKVFMKVLGSLYKYILRYKTSFYFGIVLFIASQILSSLQPFFVKWITQAVQSNNISFAFTLVTVFAVSLFINTLLYAASYYLGDKGAVKASTDLMEEVLKKIHNLDFSYHTNKSSGKLIGVMKRGTDAYYTFYEILNHDILGIAINFTVMFIAFAQLDVKYIILAISMCVLTVLFSMILIRTNIVKRNIFNESDDKVSAARIDNLINFDTVKYFAREKYEQKRFNKLTQNWRETLLEYFFTFRYFDLVVGNISNVAQAGMIFLALYDLQNNAITLPEFLLVMTFALTFFPRMSQLLFSMRELAKRYTDLKEYLLMLEEKIDVEDPIRPVTIKNPVGSISFRDIDFSYLGRNEYVLKDFSLDISPGESVALVGYSGTGKTTVTKLLMRMYDPKAGSVTIDDVSIQSMNKSYLRSLIGIVPQDPLMFNNTIYYNIAYAKPKASKAEVIAAAKAALVDDFVKELPEGYETVVGERGIKLSGGQRQRLAIARIMLEQPTVVIMDEATSALDSASEHAVHQAFWKMIKDAQHPRTSIIIAHRLSTIMKADRIIVMNNGTIAESGTHAELLNNHDSIYYKLWSMQKNGFIADGETTVS